MPAVDKQRLGPLVERFYHAFLAADPEFVAVQEGRITRLFHYLHDPAAFEAFWSAGG
jgi:hypothetical protein